MKTSFFFGLLLGLIYTLSPNEVYAQKVEDTAQKTTGKIQKIELSVTGMSCQKGCADGIDKKLSTIPGITKSKTNFNKSRSQVTFNPDVITTAEIIRIIEDRGYKAALVKTK